MQSKQTIESRRTIKLRADENNPLPVNTSESFKNDVEEIIELAGKAPFHHTCDEYYQTNSQLSGKEPWRFHALDTKACRQLLELLKTGKPLPSSEGIRQMLAAADVLILATWLPERSSSQTKKFYPNVKNMEHIAATGAAIQNLLLAATEKGITNYWSTGGILRKAKVLELLDIPSQEILLGAVFLFPDPENVRKEVEIITGKNREERSGRGKWMNWVNL